MRAWGREERASETHQQSECKKTRETRNHKQESRKLRTKQGLTKSSGKNRAWLGHRVRPKEGTEVGDKRHQTKNPRYLQEVLS